MQRIILLALLAATPATAFSESFSDLDQNLLGQIFENLEPEDQARLGSTNRSNREALKALRTRYQEQVNAILARLDSVYEKHQNVAKESGTFPCSEWKSDIVSILASAKNIAPFANDKPAFDSALDHVFSQFKLHLVEINQASTLEQVNNFMIMQKQVFLSLQNFGIDRGIVDSRIADLAQTANPFMRVGYFVIRSMLND